MEYNKQHNITPKTISKKINDITDQLQTKHSRAVNVLLQVDKDQLKKNPEKLIKQKEKQMNGAVKILDFETAAIIRDEIAELRRMMEEGKN